MIEALGDIDGVFTIADDIIVTGCGDTIPEAERDNKEKVKLLYSRCKEARIILNDEKNEITFHGHKETSNGVKADVGKVKAIVDMPQPTYVSGVRRLSGMMQYMANFIPSLSTTLETMRKLTCKDTHWKWIEECEKAIIHIKNSLPVLPLAPIINSVWPGKVSSVSLWEKVIIEILYIIYSYSEKAIISCPT